MAGRQVKVRLATARKSAQEHTRISSRRLSSFFRTSRSTSLCKRADVKALKITALIDDGAVLYLNGQPLWWFNFEIEKYGLPAMEATSIRQVLHEETPKTAILPGSLLLLDGVNVLAAEVHQVHKDSSDLLFDLELAAVISTATANCRRPRERMKASLKRRTTLPTLTHRQRRRQRRSTVPPLSRRLMPPAC
jgi:hypothetical protein